MNHFQSPECVNWPLSDAEIKETKGKSNIFWLRSRSDQKVRKTWSEKWKEEARRSSQLFQNRFRRSSAIFGDKCSTKIIRNISALLWERFFYVFRKILKKRHQSSLAWFFSNFWLRLCSFLISFVCFGESQDLNGCVLLTIEGEYIFCVNFLYMNRAPPETKN